MCTYIRMYCSIFVFVCRGVIECIMDVSSKQSPRLGHISKGDEARWKALEQILPLQVRLSSHNMGQCVGGLESQTPLRYNRLISSRLTGCVNIMFIYCTNAYRRVIAFRLKPNTNSKSKQWFKNTDKASNTAEY